MLCFVRPSIACLKLMPAFSPCLRTLPHPLFLRLSGNVARLCSSISCFRSVMPLLRSMTVVHLGWLDLAKLARVMGRRESLVMTLLTLATRLYGLCFSKRKTFLAFPLPLPSLHLLLSFSCIHYAVVRTGVCYLLAHVFRVIMTATATTAVPVYTHYYKALLITEHHSTFAD